MRTDRAVAAVLPTLAVFTVSKHVPAFFGATSVVDFDNLQPPETAYFAAPLDPGAKSFFTATLEPTFTMRTGCVSTDAPD